MHLANKIADIVERLKATRTLSIKVLTRTISNPTVPEDIKTLYRIEKHYRINGGDIPLLIILKKMSKEYKYKINIEAPIRVELLKQ